MPTNFSKPLNHQVFFSLTISTFYLKVQANETQFTHFTPMQHINTSAVYFPNNMSANSSCVILPLFPTNKISIYLVKICTAACNPVTVSTVENLHKYKQYL